VRDWTLQALRDRRFIPLGAEFFELTNAPADARGIALLDASCAMLDHVRATLAASDLEADGLIPFLRLTLPDSSELQMWDEARWTDLSGAHAWIVIDAHVFDWAEWESHQQTVRLPFDEYPQFQAIFRRYKGLSDGKAWDEYSNDILIFARER
jgi:hypothetical protein